MANTITGGDQTVTVPWKGGKGVVLSQGTYDSGTLSLQFSTDGGTTKTAFGSDTDVLANGGGAFIAGAGDIYLDLSGTLTTSASITYVVLPAEGENLQA
jgi:hypothetical protein